MFFTVRSPTNSNSGASLTPIPSCTVPEMQTLPGSEVAKLESLILEGAHRISLGNLQEKFKGIPRTSAPALGSFGRTRTRQPRRTGRRTLTRKTRRADHEYSGR